MDDRTPTTLHLVTFDADTQQVTFTCTGDETAECHNYPDDVEAWGPNTPKDTYVPHEQCWTFDWFDNNQVEYVGEDSQPADDSYGNLIPSRSRSGPITTSFETDYVEWDWLS